MWIMKKKKSNQECLSEFQCEPLVKNIAILY